MKPTKSCKGYNTNTLKLILKSASIFLSQKPPIVKSSEPSQSHTSRRCLARRASFGLTTPPRKSRRNSDSESESEPDSPRVSCVGQIEIGRGKRKKKRKEKVKRKKIAADEENPEKNRWMWEKNERKMRRTPMEVQYAIENGAQGSGVGIGTAPYLNQMKRLASGHGSLSDFEFN